jgi:hypothetical protein
MSCGYGRYVGLSSQETLKPTRGFGLRTQMGVAREGSGEYGKV